MEPSPPRPTRTLLLGGAVLLGVALVLALTGNDDPAAVPAADPAADPTTDPSAPAPPAEEPTVLAPSTRAPTTLSPTTVPATTLSPTTVPDPRLVAMTTQADEFVAGASPQELAARLLVTGLNGADLGARLSQTVGAVCVGGVFLTESNDNWAPEQDPDAFRTAFDDLDDRVWDTTCAYRPLVTTDAELGSVVRVPVDSPAAAPDWATRYVEGEPYNVLLDLQAEVADYASRLGELGVDVNFGAVADVDTSPEHFMARQGRTFGGDPGVTAALSDAVVQAHCVAGVAPTLKHFPNQGATPEDPHAEASTAIGGVDLWRTTGRLPYESTAAPVVMTGHIFMDIDPDLPASMSVAITTGLLRDELGYDGVVITDDLSTMRGAIDVIADPGDRAVAAIRAGADLVLFVDDIDAAPVIAALRAEIEADPAFAGRARESLHRILRLSLGLSDPELFPLCRPLDGREHPPLVTGTPG